MLKTEAGGHPVAFVTGGASGIGAATVRRLAERGARLAVADLDSAGAERLATEVGGIGVAVDVADTASVRAAVKETEQALGPIDVLVNNAGGDRFAYFEDTDEDSWDFVLGLNLKGTLACTHAVIAGMYKRRRGVIVNMASESGRVGTVAGATYSAAKGGVIAFTKAIAREAAPYGVRCNAVAPGPIDTPLLNRAAADAGKLGAAMKDAMVHATALGRLGQPDEVAAAVAFLASDEASYVTGHTLAVSGGLSMW